MVVVLFCSVNSSWIEGFAASTELRQSIVFAFLPFLLTYVLLLSIQNFSSLEFSRKRRLPLLFKVKLKRCRPTKFFFGSLLVLFKIHFSGMKCFFVIVSNE